MLRLLYLFIILVTTNSFAQTITLTGVVTDADGHPLYKVRYFNTKKGTKYYTNEQGEYKISYIPGSQDTVKFEDVAFDDFYLTLTKKMERRVRDKQLIVDVEMPDKVTSIVTVRPDVPDTLFGTQDYSVADFEFDIHGNLVLLTYEKNLKSGSVLRLLDGDKEVTDRYYVDGEAVELRTDFMGNIHLLTKERVFLVSVKNKNLYVWEENRDSYFKFLAPIIDSIGANIYYSNYSDLYPAFDYYEFNREDSLYKVMLKVEDEPLMELYRAEFKYVDVRTKLWAANKQLETGIDKEIWVGASVFTNSLYYEPLYAPLFKVGEDSIFVFDHYKNYMFKYTPAGGFCDSLRISYHKDARRSGWEQPLMQDEVNDKIYAIFLRNGYTYLSLIDQTTGNISQSFRLHYKYVEHIKIFGDYVYYIYRPFESVQKKYIYREELKNRS